MSKVQLQGNVSGTGVFTIASPNSNTDRTLTLPDSSGTLLSSGSAASFPSGTIIQTQYYQGPQGAGTSTSTSYVDDGVNVSITPLLASSKLYVVCTTGCSVASGYAYFRIWENTGGTLVQEVPWGNFSGDPQQLNAFTMTGWVAYGNTTTRQFKLQGKCTSGTRYINYATNPNITVFEVAA
jgi:hypothetical protein